MAFERFRKFYGRQSKFFSSVPLIHADISCVACRVCEVLNSLRIEDEDPKDQGAQGAVAAPKKQKKAHRGSSFSATIAASSAVAILIPLISCLSIVAGTPRLRRRCDQSIVKRGSSAARGPSSSADTETIPHQGSRALMNSCQIFSHFLMCCGSVCKLH